MGPLCGSLSPAGRLWAHRVYLSQTLREAIMRQEPHIDTSKITRNLQLVTLWLLNTQQAQLDPNCSCCCIKDLKKT